MADQMSALSNLKLDGIGAAIRKIRDRRGHDGSSFAALVGIDASTLSKYELGKRAIPFHFLEDVANAIEASPIALLVWCMRERFPELGDTSDDMKDFLSDALADLERRMES